MYPASGLGDTYEFEDLPETLTTPNPDPDEPGTITYTKVSSFDGTRAYTRTDPAPPAGAIRVAIGEFEGQPAWMVQEYFEDEWFTLLGGPCLVNPTFLEDQFADCYEVSNPGNGNDVAAGTVQVLRVSLCRWESANFNDGPISNALRASLEYLSGGEFEDDPRGDLWSAFSGTLQAESPAGGVKESLSSPLGTYDSDFLPSVTVSPCF
jgi:hypothetical protein